VGRGQREAAGMLFLVASWPCCRVTDIVAGSQLLLLVAGHLQAEL